MAAIIDDVRMRLEANGPECRIDEVVDFCPDLTWNQIFLAVDYLNRTSQVQLVLPGEDLSFFFIAGNDAPSIVM